MRRLATLGFVIAAATLNAAPSLTITTTSLPAAVFGQQYAPVTIDTSGDPGPFQWSFVPGFGSPPPGFVVGNGTSSLTQGTFCYGFNNQNGSANCFGNVQAPLGSYTFMVQVFSFASEQTAQQQFTLQVVQPLQFVTKSPLPTATANTFYSTQLQIIGGTIGQDGAQFTWSVINGALPAGIVLDPATGLLSGPVSNGAVPSTFTVQVIDVLSDTSIAATFTIDVQGNIVITTSSVPNATVGQPYTPFQFQAVNLPPGYTWSVLTSTPLPAPFSLSSTGLLTGSGSGTGSFPFTVLLTNSLAASSFVPAVSKNFVLYITLGPLSIKETTLPPGATQNVPYTATLTAVGGLPPYAWSFAVPNPQNLSISPTTGAISGTPPNAGTFTIPVILRDAAGGVVSVSFPFNVGPALSITTTSLPNGSLNVPYSATAVATGGATPCCRWDLTGTLPPGLNLNAANGQISGTPTAQGAFAFTLRATDSFGTVATKAFTITIGTQPLTITSGDFSGTALTALSQTLAATGGTPPYTWSVSSGTLPDGLQLNNTTGVITGTPSVAGTSQVAFTATDVNGLTGSKTIGIRILLPPLPLTSITVGSTTQPLVGLSIQSPYPFDITGVLTLTFTSSVGGTDDMVRFSNGTRTLAYTVSANTTQVTFSPANPAIVTGTVAGTITLNATMTIAGQDIAPPFTPTKTIVIDPAVPVISSVALQQVTGGLNVVVTGYSNTREVSGGSFTFTVSSGNALTQATIPVTLGPAYATWFGSTASNATGGQFKLTVPFSVTQGSAMAVTKVSVTLTNGQGASAAVSSQ